ncbi:MAG: hypothetical protein HUJ76_10235 [Parasporobacterium sp.]|nr:hypothetical protein [Parasporobacterium sp.]
MSESKIETMKGMCAVDITKFLMKKLGLSPAEAYSKFMQMELYKLLMDTESGMFLEQNEFLYECCEKELDSGEDTLYEFLKDPELC